MVCQGFEVEDGQGLDRVRNIRRWRPERGGAVVVVLEMKSGNLQTKTTSLRRWCSPVHLTNYERVCGLERGTRICQVGNGEREEDSAVARNFQQNPASAAGVLH